MTTMHLLTDADPSPMTREGTAALVEGFYALKRAAVARSPQVGVGGSAPSGSVTSLGSLPSKKPKSEPEIKKYLAEKQKRLSEKCRCSRFVAEHMKVLCEDEEAA